MTIKEAIQLIEELIGRFGLELDEDDYLEALVEMSERSTNAYYAFQETRPNE